VRETLVDNVEMAGAALAASAVSPHRLLYATPELTAPVHLSGTVRVTLRLASSKPAANVSVWLVQLPWAEGPISPFNLITRGWADPQNHASLTRGGNYNARAAGQPLVPGEFYTITFDLQPDDQVVRAGKRIGLMIFSSDRDFTLWPQPGTELTIDLGATSVALPIVGGEAALARALSAR
jgi:X-Pro dipeptidyl-peptidase